MNARCYHAAMIWCAPAILAPLVAAVLGMPGGWSQVVDFEQSDECDLAEIVVTQMEPARHRGYIGWATWDPLRPDVPCAVEIAPTRHVVYALNHEIGHCLLRVEGHPTNGVLDGTSSVPSQEELEIARARLAE